MGMTTERHDPFKPDRRVCRELMPDACESDRCLRDGAPGMDPCFPVSWAVHGTSIAARYYCARCGRNWACWWDLTCVSVGAVE
jgi:hypothetical protein